MLKIVKSLFTWEVLIILGLQASRLSMAPVIKEVFWHHKTNIYRQKKHSLWIMQSRVIYSFLKSQRMKNLQNVNSLSIKIIELLMRLFKHVLEMKNTNLLIRLKDNQVVKRKQKLNFWILWMTEKILSTLLRTTFWNKVLIASANQMMRTKLLIN